MSTSDTTHSPDQLPLLTPPFQSGAPKRKIFTETDIQPWLDSEAYDYLETLIARMSYAVDGKSVEDSCKESEVRHIAASCIMWGVTDVESERRQSRLSSSSCRMHQAGLTPYRYRRLRRDSGTSHSGTGLLCWKRFAHGFMSWSG